MSVSTNITKSEQGMAVSGALVFSSVTGVLEQGNVHLQQHQATAFEIDCKDMKRIDSAGIALLLDWKRQCQTKQMNCEFTALPKQAKVLIEAYHLQAFI